VAILAAVAAGVVAPPAAAQVLQTGTTTPLPQPVGMAEFNLVTQSWGWNSMTTSWKDPYTGLQLTGTTWTDTMNGNRVLPVPIPFGQFYAPPAFPQFVDGDAITLQGMFKWRGEKIDWRADAKTSPGYFSPTCGFTGEYLLNGGNCKVAFAWYNITDPNTTTPPNPSDLHVIIPADPTYLNCLDENGGAKTDGFCPKGWDSRSPRNLNIREWQPKPFSSGNITSDPNYQGKYVGFAIVGNPATVCTQTKYSLLGQNVKNTSGKPWVTSLIYQSTVDPEGYYIAFEDLPMSPADWTQTGVPGATGGCDGDFNDFVFFVSGVTCAGGNKPCTTPLQGACSLGRTDCALAGQTPTCHPIVQPGPEVCDNVDNDCNGLVDDGPNLCPDANKPICFQGSCVAKCSSGEFPCPNGTTCDANGNCVDPLCSGVTCPMGQACRGGTCVDPCTGVVCPTGETCQLGRCVDPCMGVTCPAQHVCEKGVCLADCHCRGCDTGFACSTTGACVDTACATVTCPTGEVCQMGKCIDPCAGVVCPGGGTCNAGVCSAPISGASSGGTGGGVSFPVGSGGSQSGPGAGNGGMSAGSGTGGPTKGKGSNAGCGCRVDGSGEASSLAWLAAALGLGLSARRRRARS
jgi:MYXO-CTERM domain-containing protein